MKKTFFALGVFVAMAISPTLGVAQEPFIESTINLTLIDTTPVKDYPRTPVRPLSIGLSGYTLHFPELGDFVLNLYSEDEVGNLTLEYTETILASTSSTQLPSDLSGMYVIEIVCHGQRFRGEIEL